MRKRQAAELAVKTDQLSTDVERVRVEVAQLREAFAGKLEKLEAWLIVHDPSTKVAGEAYEGLRKQLSAGAKSRRLHLVDLSKLDDLLRTLEERLETEPETEAATILMSVRERLDEQMRDAGLVPVSATTDTISVFDGVSAGEIDPSTVVETVRPAYIDTSGDTPIPIRRGQVRVVDSPEVSDDPRVTAEGTQGAVPAAADVAVSAAEDTESSAEAEEPTVEDTEASGPGDGADTTEPAEAPDEEKS